MDICMSERTQSRKSMLVIVSPHWKTWLQMSFESENFIRFINYSHYRSSKEEGGLKTNILFWDHAICIDLSKGPAIFWGYSPN